MVGCDTREASAQVRYAREPSPSQLAAPAADWYRNSCSVLIDTGLEELGSGIQHALAKHAPKRMNAVLLLRPNPTSFVRVLIVSSRSAGDMPIANFLKEIRAVNPAVMIVVCGRGDKADYSNLREFAKLGADDFVSVRGPSDLRALDERVTQLIRLPAPAYELAAVLTALGPEHATPIVLYCLRHGFEAPRATKVAKQFSLSIQALNRLLAASGLPSTAALVRLGRQYYAKELARRGGGSKEMIARQLGTADAVELARQRRRLRIALGRKRASAEVFVRLLYQE